MHIKKIDTFYFTNNYEKKHIKKINKNTSIIFRNYRDKLDLNKLKELKNFCKSSGRKLFLANNLKLALSLRLNGVYIPSFNKQINLLSYQNRKGFLILGSAHNIKEIRQKERQGIDIIFLSPVFRVLKSKKYLGVIKFNLLSQITKKKIIALGGFNTFNLIKFNMLRANGFAGISYFQKKRPHKGAA